jgi:hypothetical protein
VKSPSAEDKEHLGIYRYLLTSPRSDNRIYKEETAALKDLIVALNDELSFQKRTALIFPGHGEYYRAEEMAKRRPPPVTTRTVSLRPGTTFYCRTIPNEQLIIVCHLGRDSLVMTVFL